MLSAVDQRIGDQGAGQDDAGQRRAHEQLGHGDVGDAGVDDQHDGRRDDGSQDGRDRGHARGELGGIALLLHGGDGDAADGGGGGHAGAGDGAEQRGGYHGHDAQAALDVADKRVTDVYQLGGDAAGHDVARQDKERNGQQRTGVHAGEEFLRQHDRGKPCYIHGHQGGNAEGDIDGQAHESEYQKQNDQKQTDVHGLTPFPHEARARF